MVEDEQIVNDAEEWLIKFMRDSFPVGLQGKIDIIVRDVAMSAYLDGVLYGREWADAEMSRKKSLIILPH